MTDNHLAVRPDFAEDLHEENAGAAGVAESISPLSVIHGLLRGRYLWVALLTAVLGGAGFLLGYKFTHPIYRSMGLIHIRPNKPVVMYATEQNNVMPMFEAFIDAQAAMVQSPRVRDMAMQSEAWRAVGRGLSNKAIARFEESLDVSHTRGGELIRVTFDDRDPKVAALAVKSVLESYQKIYVERDIQSDAQVLQVLEERRTALENQLRSTNDRILSIANEYGSETPEKTYEFKVEEVNRLEGELRRTEIDLLAAESAQRPAPATAPAVRPLSTEEIALLNPDMARYCQDHQALAQNLRQMSMHLGERHPAIQNARWNLAELEQAIRDFRRNFNEARAAGILTPHGTVRGMPEGRTSESQDVGTLRTQKASLESMLEKLKAETIDLGRKNLQLKSLRGEADTIRERLAETKTRIEHLSVESVVSGRVSVASAGDEPVQPVIDRRIPFGILGGMGGGLLGFGSVLLFALLHQRLHSVADTRGRTFGLYRILGIVPALGENLDDPVQVAVAAHGVHRIRTLLQTDHGRTQRVFAISSPSAGDGKTSLTAALGLSFAAAQSRTLLIDFDIVGGGLSRRMQPLLHRDIGDVIVSKGILTRQELDHARQAAEAAGVLLEDILVRQGIATAQALSDLMEEAPRPGGLLQAMAGAPLRMCVSETLTPRLFVLALGDTRPHHVTQISPVTLRQIIEEARQQFDTVLVDTGPILGSLEASTVAGAVDRIVLVLSRGQDRHLAVESLKFLESIQGRLAGIVFNRAQPSDVVHSVYTSQRSVVSQPRGPHTRVPKLSGQKTDGALDPLAVAVISSTAPVTELSMQ